MHKRLTSRTEPDPAGTSEALPEPDKTSVTRVSCHKENRRFSSTVFLHDIIFSGALRLRRLWHKAWKTPKVLETQVFRGFPCLGPGSAGPVTVQGLFAGIMPDRSYFLPALSILRSSSLKTLKTPFGLTSSRRSTILRTCASDRSAFPVTFRNFVPAA